MIRPEDVTIIIPHLGETPESEYALDECLKSLNETVPNIKNIVASNGYVGEKRAELCKGNITIEEQGQCKAVNAAVATTNTKWIFVTNDDMIYAPGWFEKLTYDLNSNQIGCFSPQLVEPRGGAPTFIEHFLGGAGGDFNKQEWLDYAKTHTGNVLRPGFNLPLLLSRELWDIVGGYDINYDPWGSNSDSDLEYKIKLAGVQPFQNTACIVYHFSQTSGTFNPANDAARFRNYAYFKEKWGFDRTDNGIWEATFDIPTKEQGRIYNPPWEGKYENS